MCMHDKNNSDGIYYVPRMADRIDYDSFSEQYNENKIRGNY